MAAPNYNEQQPPSTGPQLLTLPPTPSPSLLHKPNEMQPTAWFTTEEFRQPPYTLIPITAEYTPRTKNLHTTKTYERPKSLLNPLAPEFKPQKPIPSPHPHQSKSEEPDTDEPEWSSTEEDILPLCHLNNKKKTTQ